MSLGLIFSAKESDWKSCTRIVSNILKSYQLVLERNSYSTYNFSTENEEYSSYQLAKKIKQDNVKELIFIDHDPHPLKLIKYLSNLDIKLNKVTFHIYGDFTLFLKQWNSTFNLLKGISIVLIVASHKQKSLLELILCDEATIVVCPFPVNSTLFHFDKNIREVERASRNITEEEVVFIYTGRISSAKYCHALIKNYAKAREMTNRKSRLILAGTIDDIVNPVLGKYYTEGYYQQKILEQLKLLPEDVQESVEFCPGLNDLELLSLYNASDVFVGLSLYNDEDYGMSPIEALFCGEDAILTDWGGYHSFKLKDVGTTSLVETNMTKKGAGFINPKVIKLLIVKMQSVKSVEDRALSSKKYQEHFSIKACSEILRKINMEIEGMPCGFSNLGRNICKSKTPFIDDNGNASDHYFEVYKSYVS